LKYTEPGEFIELLRNASIATRLGARVLPGLQGPVSFPKQTGAGTATWVGENPGSDVSESDATLGAVGLAAKTLQSTTSYSRQLLRQAIIDVEQMVRQDLTAVHALAWDRAVFHGGGTLQPTGIYAASGVNAVAIGGVPTFGKLVDMITEVAIDNAILGKLGWATTPGLAGVLMQTLVASAAGSAMIWSGKITEGQVAGYTAIASNQIASNLGTGTDEHGVVFGNWDDVIIGTWGAMEIVVDPYRLKKQGMIELTSFEMVDIALRHPESFCKGTGATLTPPGP
jgi:HK97 family phage major capsid protein